MNKRWIYVAALALSIILALYLYQRFRVAPDIDFATIETVTLENEPRRPDAVGKVPTVVCFAASWCAPCRYELDALSKVGDELGTAQVIVIGDEPIGRLKLMKDLGRYPFEFYKLEGSFTSIGIHSVPTTYILSSDGRVVKKMTGMVDWTDPSSRKHLLSLLQQ